MSDMSPASIMNSNNNNHSNGSHASLKPNSSNHQGNISSPPKMTTTSSQSSHLTHAHVAPAIPFNRILSPVEYNKLRFLILDCPTDTTLPLYLQEMKTRNVTDVVRVCEPTYSKSLLEENGIKVHDCPFKDGGIPSNEIILNFLSLCDERFGGLIAAANTVNNSQNSSASSNTSAAHQGSSTNAAGTLAAKSTFSTPCIAVHCVAGLGRAPILVAITLIEAGMTPIDSVEYVRQRRRGALNTVQLQFLMDSYKKQWTKKTSKMSNFFSSSSSSSTSKRTGSPPHEKSLELSNSSSSSAHHGSTTALGGLKESLTRVFRFNRKSSTVSTSD